MYGMPQEIDVQADGPLRIITLNRPEALNAVNEALHTGLAQLWPRLSEDREARAAVITGSGKAFSAGGDFTYLAELSRDPDLRSRTIAHGRDLVLGMARCRVPVVAAVNGPAVGLGCSLVALSDIVYFAETAYLADPHVQVGLVAADGGPLTWPLHTSLHLAKEFALTGARIPAERAVAIGLGNHVVADPLSEALACAKRIAGLPQQAAESTKRLLNLHLERAVLATLDFAMAAEEHSFQTEDFRGVIAKLTTDKT
jgi:enoyl-CoA hydratase